MIGAVATRIFKIEEIVTKKGKNTVVVINIAKKTIVMTITGKRKIAVIGKKGITRTGIGKDAIVVIGG